MSSFDMSGFDFCFEKLIGHEGGYVNHPDDPGGETNFGVSKRSYPDVDIAGLTLDDAKAIYRKDFWDRCACDSLPSALQMHVFDAAVNSGTGRAAKWLQAACGAAQDGVIGAQTKAAIAATDPGKLASRFNGHRLSFMASLSTWDAFGKGWARRVAQNLMEV